MSDAAAAVKVVMGKLSKQEHPEEDVSGDDGEACLTLPEKPVKAKSTENLAKAKNGMKKPSVMCATAVKKVKTKADKKPKNKIEKRRAKTSYTVTVEASINRVRVRFDDDTSFSKKYGGANGSKEEALAQIKMEAKKMLQK